MDKYKIVKKVGEGSYGCVYEAIHRATGETVAIKSLKKKYDSWEKCLNLPEVQSLMKMNNHPHVVKLKEIVREYDNMFFVFEYMEHNFNELIKVLKSLKMKGVPSNAIENEIRDWCFQIFQALAYVHKSGYIHRDFKPDNILLSVLKGGGLNIKLADFGMAREIWPGTLYTQGVCTLWYRAPELLLGSSFYGTSVDMWSAGVVMAELFNLYPMFSGSTELEQMCQIYSVLGSPTQDSWAEGLQLADSINYKFPQCSGADMSVMIPTASADAINLITSLCSWDPRKRPTAAEALCHPFFNACYHIPPPFPLVEKQYCCLCDISKAKTTHASYQNAAAAAGRERKFKVECPLMTQNGCTDNFSTDYLSFFQWEDDHLQVQRKQPAVLPAMNVSTSAVIHSSVNKVVPATRQQEVAAAAGRERKFKVECPLMTQNGCTDNFSIDYLSFFQWEDDHLKVQRKQPAVLPAMNVSTSTVIHSSVNKVVPATRQQEVAAAAGRERKFKVECPLMTQNGCTDNFSIDYLSFFQWEDDHLKVQRKQPAVLPAMNVSTSAVIHSSVNKVVPATRQQEVAAATSKNPFLTPPIKAISLRDPFFTY